MSFGIKEHPAISPSTLPLRLNRMASYLNRSIDVDVDIDER